MKDRTQEAIKLAAQGMSQRAIGERLGCSQKTVSRILRKAEAEGARVFRRAPGRPSKANPQPSSPGPEALPPQLGDDELAKKLASLDIPAELTVVRSTWLPEARKLVDQALEAGNAAQARDWVKIYVDMAERLLQAIPPAPPDPKEDPRNLEARRDVLGHLQRLADVQRRELGKQLCDDCRVKVLGGDVRHPLADKNTAGG